MPTLSTDELVTELEEAREELRGLHAFLDEIGKFSDLVTRTKETVRALEARELDLKTDLAEVREELKSLRNLVDSTNNGMLALLEPGPTEFMPLFDRMERADTKKHGKNAAKWREQPIACLRLSPVASNALIAAEILFVGQLQDRIIEDPETWFESIDGLTKPIAAAVADKLAEFAKKGGKA